jgi:hypothetical protein
LDAMLEEHTAKWKEKAAAGLSHELEGFDAAI